MEVLTKKQFEAFDYLSRYTQVPYYYNTKDQKYIYGIGYNLTKDTAWVAHKVTQEDSLDSLSLTYYNNPTFWWVIAYFNDIQEPFMQLSDYFDIIKIPSISSIKFEEMR